MKVRLSGTQDDCAAAVDALAAGFVVREVSAFYPKRGSSVLGRVYLDARPVGPATGRVRATAARTDDRCGLPGGPATSLLDRTGGPS